MTTDGSTKSTLFCPDCDHRSRIGDDWRVVETAGYCRYVCPDCGADIATRPAVTGDGSRR